MWSEEKWSLIPKYGVRGKVESDSWNAGSGKVEFWFLNVESEKWSLIPKCEVRESLSLDFLHVESEKVESDCWHVGVRGSGSLIPQCGVKETVDSDFPKCGRQENDVPRMLSQGKWSLIPKCGVRPSELPSLNVDSGKVESDSKCWVRKSERRSWIPKCWVRESGVWFLNVGVQVKSGIAKYGVEGKWSLIPKCGVREVGSLIPKCGVRESGVWFRNVGVRENGVWFPKCGSQGKWESDS